MSKECEHFFEKEESPISRDSTDHWECRKCGAKIGIEVIEFLLDSLPGECLDGFLVKGGKNG